MRFTIINVDNNHIAVWETDDDVWGQILLDSISIPFGKVPELIKSDTCMMLLINLTAQEIDEAVASLMQMAHGKEVSLFIQKILSLKEKSCVAQYDVAWSASGNIGWSLSTLFDGAGIAE